MFVLFGVLALFLILHIHHAVVVAEGDEAAAGGWRGGEFKIVASGGEDVTADESAAEVADSDGDGRDAGAGSDSEGV